MWEINSLTLIISWFSVLVRQDFRCTVVLVTNSFFGEGIKLSCVIILTLSKGTQKLYLFLYSGNREVYGEFYERSRPLLWPIPICARNSCPNFTPCHTWLNTEWPHCFFLLSWRSLVFQWVVLRGQHSDAHSGSQSQCRTFLILAAHGASHIINAGYRTSVRARELNIGEVLYLSALHGPRGSHYPSKPYNESRYMVLDWVPSFLFIDLLKTHGVQCALSRKIHAWPWCPR